MSNIDTKKIARDKAGIALDLISRARNMLGAAINELSCIDGACEQYDDVGDAYEAMSALWHQVNMSLRLDELDLDSDTKESLAKKSATDE